MKISLNNIGKRFNREWIFRHVNYQFVNGKSYAITGSNGSGKSTLLQVIAGALMHSEGEISVEINDSPVPFDQLFKYISIATPYLELIEEMTALEMIQFHKKFKSISISENELLAKVGLSNAEHKQIRYFSSGMKQRLKLGLAFYSETPVLFLDEPTTNLDQQGVDLYLHLIKDFIQKKLIIISSNDLVEYDFCDEKLSIADFK